MQYYNYISVAVQPLKLFKKNDVESNFSISTSETLN